MPFELVEDEVESPVEESYLSQGARGLARTTSRIGEQVAGFPGDIFSMINHFIANPITENIFGGKATEYENTFLGKMLPPTSKHRQATKSAFGEYTEPQNDVETFIDDLFSDATSLALPGLKSGKIAKNIFSKFAISLGGNVAKDTVKDVTGDEKKSQYAKMGTLLFLSLFDKPSAAKAVSDLYKPLELKVANLNPVNATRLESSLNNLISKMSKGTQAPSEKFIIDESQAILNKIQNGKINPEELWASKRSLNEKLADILYKNPTKQSQARARKLSTVILDEIDKGLKETAKQDPKFYKQLKSADNAFGTIAKSNVIANYIDKNLKYNPLSSGLIYAFKDIGSGLGGAASTALIPYQVGKVMYRMANSKELTKHYINVLKAASAENAVLMNKELRILDKKLQKEESKDKFELID